jgi:hypothetical protein
MDESSVVVHSCNPSTRGWLIKTICFIVNYGELRDRDGQKVNLMVVIRLREWKKGH